MQETSTPHRAPGRAPGRELALGVLCHLESYPRQEWESAAQAVLFNPPRGDGPEEEAFAGATKDPATRAFAQELIAAYISRATDVDAHIEQTSARWRLARMDQVDRNVIRLAATELIAVQDTPRAVVIAEAVRLASRYGSERSAPFVNGLVEALAKRLRPAQMPSS